MRLSSSVSFGVIAACSVAALASPLAAGPAATAVLNFDDVESLDEYAEVGVTFSPNISIWFGGDCTVFENPDCGPASAPNAICVGPCGGVTGSIFFDPPVTFVSIIALSGPGPDNLNAGTRIEAFFDGKMIADDFADSSVQFDFLAVEGLQIDRVDLLSPSPNAEAWDDLGVLTKSDFCPTDLDEDQMTGASDLAILLSEWGECIDPCAADFDRSGTVDSADLAALLAAWGPCAAP